MGKAERFIERLNPANRNTIQDWLELEKELDEFAKNEATEEELKAIYQDYWWFTEMLFMTCSGYRWEKAQSFIKRHQDEGRTASLEADVRKFWKEEAIGSEKELLQEHLPADLFY